MTDAETIEEILADNMKDVASRAGLMQQIGKKNKSPVQRLISWLKSVSDKFTDFFYTSKHGLTRELKNKIYDAFGEMARSIVDEKGNAVFRFNNRTKGIDIASGEPLPAMKFSVRDTVKNIVKIIGKEFGEYYFKDNNGAKGAADTPIWNPLTQNSFQTQVQRLQSTKILQNRLTRQLNKLQYK